MKWGGSDPCNSTRFVLFNDWYIHSDFNGADYQFDRGMIIKVEN